MLRIILFIIIAAGSITGQLRIDVNNLSSEYALKENRDKYRDELKQKIESFRSLRPDPSSAMSWISLFRELELTNQKTSQVDSLVQTCVEYLSSAHPKFKRAIIEAVNTLTPGKYSDEVFNILSTTRNAQVFGAAASYLIKQNCQSCNADTLLKLLSNQFPDYNSNDILQFLYYDLKLDISGTMEIPDIEELLGHDYQSGKTIIFSLQRANRIYPGLTIIKGPDGKFVRNEDSTVFHVQQLACSTSEFPGYLSQGNTPQGIYSIVGSYVSPTASIGPTANVITRIPFEVTPDIFYHGQSTNNDWQLEEYLSLFPEGWRDYLPVQEAFFAGKTGRRLIVMHGSTDDLSFYENLPYYPLTPSKGCLTATEIWDDETGKCIRSDQVKLMNAFYSTGKLTGYLVVVNIDNKNMPVTLDELLPAILQSEEDDLN